MFRKNSILIGSVLAIFLVTASFSLNSVFAEQQGTLEVYITNQSELRASPSGMSMKIYQDLNDAPWGELPVSSNPFSINSLPLGHSYKIELYDESIFMTFQVIKMQEPKQNLRMTVPSNGGMQFFVVYNDKETPVVDATIEVYAYNGELVTRAETYGAGESPRIWLPPTTRDTDYYYTDIIITSNITKRISPITINPGSQQMKVVTEWPPTVEKLFTVKIFDSLSSQLKNQKGYFVEMMDREGNLVKSSTVFPVGEAYFSNFKVNDYDLILKKTDENGTEEITRKSVSIDGTNEGVSIFIPDVEEKPKVISIPFEEEKSTAVAISPKEGSTDDLLLDDKATKTESFENCNCVAFRFSNVQDYYLDEVQVSLLNLFDSRNIPLTIAVSGDSIGDDSNVVDSIKEKLLKGNLLLANRGWELTDFTELTEQQQHDSISNTNKKLVEVFGQNSSAFIAPYNKFNDDTIKVLRENGITYLSSNAGNDPPPYNFQNAVPFHVPYTIAVKDLVESESIDSAEQIYKLIIDHQNQYGFAVINFQSQNFAQQDDGYVNSADQAKLSILNSFLDLLEDRDISFVTLDEIPSLVSPKTSPSWVDNIYSMYEQGKISYGELTRAIDYLVSKKIINFA